MSPDRIAILDIYEITLNRNGDPNRQIHVRKFYLDGEYPDVAERFGFTVIENNPFTGRNQTVWIFWGNEKNVEELANAFTRDNNPVFRQRFEKDPAQAKFPRAA